jgi:hypothetical protein
MTSITRLNIVTVRYAEKAFKPVSTENNFRKNTVVRSITRSPKTSARMTGFTNNDGVSNMQNADLNNLKKSATLLYFDSFGCIVRISKFNISDFGSEVASGLRGQEHASTSAPEKKAVLLKLEMSRHLARDVSVFNRTAFCCLKIYTPPLKRQTARAQFGRLAQGRRTHGKDVSHAK